MGANTGLLGGRQADYQHVEVLDVLAQSATPAVATDLAGHILFWNRAAERLLNRPGREGLGRRCYDVLAGRDVFGHRFCRENCSVVSMGRKGEAVQGFEMVVTTGARQGQALNMTILNIPGSRPDLFTLVHLLRPADRTSRLKRALERLGAARPKPAPGDAWPPAAPLTASAPAPSLTDREKELLGWVAAGLQSEDVAQKLGISLATVRDHIHSILEKLDVHSKLEAVSLAFRQGWVGPDGGPRETASPRASRSRRGSADGRWPRVRRRAGSGAR